MTKQQILLKKAEQLNISITMFQLVREVLDFNPDGDINNMDNNLASPSNWDFVEAQIPGNLQNEHSYQIDLQDGNYKHVFDANDNNFYEMLAKAIAIKSQAVALAKEGA